VPADAGGGAKRSGKERSKAKESAEAGGEAQSDRLAQGGGPELSGLAKLIQLGVASRQADDEQQALEKAWGTLPDAAARHLRELQKQVLASHEVIRALVEQCVHERDAKEAALREAEAARRLADKSRVT